MNRLYFIIFFCIVLVKTNIAQECWTTYEIDTTDLLKAEGVGCADKLNYSVYPHYHMTPIKTIRMSFHVIQKSDGSGSFNGSENFIKSYFQKLIDSANYSLAHLSMLTQAHTSPHVVDSRIRFRLENVYFHENDSLYIAVLPKQEGIIHDATISEDANDFYISRIAKNSQISDDDKNNVLHVIMFPKGSNGVWGGSVIYPHWVFEGKPYAAIGIVMRAYEEEYNYWYNINSNYHNAVKKQTPHLIHEVGHTLGLSHKYYGGINGTQCIEKCNDIGCVIEMTSNNYMDTKLPFQSSFSECQIATMHYTLMNTTNKKPVVKYIPDYCNYNSAQTITIHSGQDIAWNGSKNLTGNVVVHGKLTVSCNISIPKSGMVTVANGGKLLIAQGDFDNVCNDTWKGIVVENGGYLELGVTHISDYSILVKSGGVLKINGDVELSGNNQINIASGAYLCIQNGSNITLKDNLSLLNLHPNFINGINMPNSNCIATPHLITYTGQGAINTFALDNYIQNEVISADTYYTGKNVYIGYDVTPTKSYGNVFFNSSNSTIVAEKSIIINKGVQISEQSMIIIKNME